MPHRYRASLFSCRLCSGVRDGTETSSTLRCWSSARRAVVSSELMWPSGVLCTRSETVELFACCVTLATTLLALDILWRYFSLGVGLLVHIERIIGTSRLCAIQIYVLLTYYGYCNTFVMCVSIILQDVHVLDTCSATLAYLWRTCMDGAWWLWGIMYTDSLSVIKLIVHPHQKFWLRLWNKHTECFINT